MARAPRIIVVELFASILLSSPQLPAEMSTTEMLFGQTMRVEEAGSFLFSFAFAGSMTKILSCLANVVLITRFVYNCLTGNYSDRT